MPFSPRQISCISGAHVVVQADEALLFLAPLALGAGGGEDVEGDHRLAVLGVHPLERGLVGLGEVAVEVLGLEYYLAHFLMISPKLPLPMPTALPSSKSRWHSSA